MRIFRAVAGKSGLADQKGVAAIEFALILPFMLVLYLGGVELSEGIILNRQTTLAATTVANIVAQYTSISASTQMPDILKASSEIFIPYSTSAVTIVVSSISIDGNGNATVTWSQALNGTARTAGQPISIPANLAIPNTTLIFSEATYAYTPTIDFISLGTKSLYASIFMVPRASTNINLTT